MTDALLGALEQRVAKLEQELGTQQAEVPLTTGLNDAFQQLQKLVEEHEHIKQIWEQYAEIQKLVPPEGVEAMATPDPVKAQVILADQDRLQDTCRQFEAVSRGEKFINSEPLREVPSHSVKLKPLRAVHLSQVEGARDQRDRVFSLLQAYNNVVMMLSEQFVKWDRILASAEQRKGTAA